MSDLEVEPVRKGRSVPVGESQFFDRPSRRRQQAADAEAMGFGATLCCVSSVRR